MPLFQPGNNRYFGNSAQPIARATARSLPFVQPAMPAAPIRPMIRPARPGKVKPFVIGKTERTDITKRLLKMPNYVPASTTKSLKTFAKKILGHKDEYTKEEVVFAAGALQSDQKISDASHQKKFIQGEVEALSAVKDRHISSPYAFQHQSKDIAGQTLRTVTTEYKKEQAPKPSRAERLANITHRSDADSSSATASSTPTWKAPVALGDSGAPIDTGERPAAGTGWNAPFAPVTPSGVPADAVHAGADHRPQSVAGGGADILILSDRVSDLILHQWSAIIPRHLTHMPLSTVPLIKTFPHPPHVLVIDAEPTLDPHAVASLPNRPVLFVFGVERTSASGDAWAKLGATLIDGELTGASLKNVLAPKPVPAGS